MKPNLRVVPREPETILPYRRGESASEIAERIRLGVRREPMCSTILGGPVGQPALAKAEPVSRLGPSGFDRAHGER
jgi:hypothetical protein